MLIVELCGRFLTPSFLLSSLSGSAGRRFLSLCFCCRFRSFCVSAGRKNPRAREMKRPTGGSSYLFFLYSTSFGVSLSLSFSLSLHRGIGRDGSAKTWFMPVIWAQPTPKEWCAGNSALKRCYETQTRMEWWWRFWCWLGRHHCGLCTGHTTRCKMLKKASTVPPQKRRRPRSAVVSLKQSNSFFWRKTLPPTSTGRFVFLFDLRKWRNGPNRMWYLGQDIGRSLHFFTIFHATVGPSVRICRRTSSISRLTSRGEEWHCFALVVLLRTHFRNEKKPLPTRCHRGQYNKTAGEESLSYRSIFTAKYLEMSKRTSETNFISLGFRWLIFLSLFLKNWS